MGRFLSRNAMDDDARVALLTDGREITTKFEEKSVV